MAQPDLQVHKETPVLPEQQARQAFKVLPAQQALKEELVLKDRMACKARWGRRVRKVGPAHKVQLVQQARRGLWVLRAT